MTLKNRKNLTDNGTFIYFLSTCVLFIKQYCYTPHLLRIVLSVACILMVVTSYQVLHSRQSPGNVLQGNRRNLYVKFNGRLGNHMFQFSSLLGIAKKNNMTALVPTDTRLWRVFQLGCSEQDRIYSKETTLPHLSRSDCRCGNEDELVNPTVVSDTSAGIYRTWYKELRVDTLVDSYLQSYKYFENIKTDLVNTRLEFQEGIQKEATDYITDVRSKRNGGDVTVVGMHVRRGDFVRQIRRGYGVATRAYLYRAMNYFKRKYTNVVFIVTSNEIYWCQDNIIGPYDLHFSHIKDGALDLAVLVTADHVIITTGSFSWWAGYLNKGETIYYHGFPVEGSPLAELYSKTDYFPPWWTAL